MKYTLLLLAFSASYFSTNAQSTFSLSQSIDYCLKNHPSIAVSNNKIAIAKEKSKQSLASYLPQISGTGSFVDNTTLQTTVLPAGVVGPEAKQITLGTQFNTSASFDVSQTIYDQSKITGIKANKPYTLLSELQKQQNQEALVYNASVAYFQVLIYKEQLKNIEANKAKYEGMLSVLTNQFSNGVTLERDLDRVQVSLNSANYQIEDATTKLQLALNNLKYSLPSLTTIKLKTVNIELEKFNIKTKVAAFIPTVSVFGKLATQSLSNNFSDAFKNWNSYNYFGLSVNVPLFNGGKRRSLVDEERLNLLNDEKDFEITKESLRLQFENAKTAIGTSYSSFKSNKDNLELSKKVVAITEYQFTKGIASLSDYLNDNTAYKNAQSSYINSLYNLMLSQLNYQQAQGTLLSFLKQIK